MRPTQRLARIVISALMLTGPAVASANPAFPSDADDIHLGVATCAGSTCHGASRPLSETPVLQNEFTTWERQDAHSNAYKVLLTSASKELSPIWATRNRRMKRPNV